MEDRELLELAAKAAEISGTWLPNGTLATSELGRWNPLTNDGDALRLAVKLEIGMFPPKVPQQGGDFAVASLSEQHDNLWIQERVSSDPYAATRRAIVCAAAEIGKGMPSNSNSTTP